VQRALATLALVAASSTTARAATEPAVPPPIPGGVADASGTLGYFAVQDGSVVAVDLANGQRRWTTREGRWPLAARAGWLAVAAPDPAQRNTLHVRFLRPADGKLIVDASVRFPDGIQISTEGDSVDGEVVIASHNASLTLSADTDGGRLRVSWVAQSWIPSGFRPSPVQKVSGVVLVDPARGAVEHRGGPATPASSLLPAGFVPTRGAIYWSWARYGAAWTDKPRAFQISSGVVGFFSYESQPERRLLLNRLQNGKALPPTTIATGEPIAPLVSLDGRFVVISRGVAEHPLLEVFDLARGGGTIAVGPKLPALAMKFRPPYAVIGPRLYFVAEDEGMSGPNNGTVFLRKLVALDGASGRVSWLHPLTARFLPAPTPGAR
jgi:PQQ-like domain